jgi:hypothetical protein
MSKLLDESPVIAEQRQAIYHNPVRLYIPGEARDLRSAPKYRGSKAILQSRPNEFDLLPGPFASCLMPRAFLTSLPGLVKNLTIFIRPQDALVAISGAK